MKEEKKPELLKKTNPSSYQTTKKTVNNNLNNNPNKFNQNKGSSQIQNNNQGMVKEKKINNNYDNSPKQKNSSKMNSDTFKSRLKMFEPK